MGDAGFTLDERLERSSYLILRRGGIQIRLADDSRFPWVLLIPEQAQASELHDLDKELRRDIIDLATRLGKVMKGIFEADKVNVAAIGNLVPQLHVHVVARRQDDDAWPAPIWGFGEPVPLTEKLRRARAEAIAAAMEQELPT